MLSIIITTLNEKDSIINQTIKSIRATSDAEIIVIDDFSTNIPKIEDKNVILHRNDFRMGVGQSRHLGACLSKNKWILFTDAHMVFQSGFHDNFIKYQESSTEKTVYCGTCLGLNYDNQNIDKYQGKYCGARLELYNDEEKQVLEGKWINEQKGDNYEISCLMGALYFIRKEYYFNLRGLSELRGWGSDEPLLSLKTWLSGGEIRLLKDVRAGHIFRDSAPYSTETKLLVYNKIRMILSLIRDNALQKILINKIPNDINKSAALQLISKDINFIQEHAAYYKSIFSRDIYWFCNKFNIAMP